MGIVLDFERPLADLRKRLEALDKDLAEHPTEAIKLERRTVADELEAQVGQIFGALTRWQKVQVARHPQRPQTLDYAKAVFAEFTELHGDRRYGDDRAIVGGPARLEGRVVMLVGHQRGHDTKERVEHNGGVPHPEGYRKALRLYQQAEKFGMPLVTLVDTPGASPGLEDEQRGQAWALAENIAALCSLTVPIVSVVVGEGCSGGALALCVADRLIMLEHAVFSVATPEATASMLWRDSKHAPDAAEALRITAQDAMELGVIDGIIPEPPGGAHAAPASAASTLRDALLSELNALDNHPPDTLLASRYAKYRRIGAFLEA